jgi:hypothetical protein
MVKKSQPATDAGESIRELIRQAQKNDRRDRAASERYSFFRPVSIKTASGRRYSAFSREISEVGIGLLHDMALASGQTVCEIISPDGTPTTLTLNIIWCEPCGEGWYISGGEFVTDLGDDA